MILRPYQEKCLTDVRSAFASGPRAVVLVAPCGAGKTVMFAKIAKLATERKTRSVILVHRDSLLTQASRKLTDSQVHHGIIAPGYRTRGELVQVASVQTIVRHLAQFNFDLLIPDEAHHSVSPTYSKIFAHYSKAKILGVTATPIRTNGQGLDSVFQKMVLGPSITKLIEEGYLVEPITYGPTHALDLSGVGTTAGDYNILDLATHMDVPRITGDAIAAYTKICPGVPAIAFTVNVQHGKDVAAAFQAAGYRSESVDGKMDLKIIRARLAALATGEIQVLSTCNLVSEGTDIPDVVAAINLRPTRSLGLSIQQGGRALRPVYAPGYDLSTKEGRLVAIAASPKPKAIILDHAGNCFRFMTVDEPHVWTLEGRKKRKRGDSIAIALRQCPKCAHTHKPKPRCPLCNYEYPIKAETPDTVSGELAPIDKAALRRAKNREVAQARTRVDLDKIAKARSYHPGWTDHILREREAKRTGAVSEGRFFE
jgi:superfamily II DNA or RNA helicase